MVVLRPGLGQSLVASHPVRSHGGKPVVGAFGGRTIIDKTGLAGKTIITAVQQRFGMRWESQKGPAEVLVIDRAQQPMEN
jgi:hypothetical protein